MTTPARPSMPTLPQTGRAGLQFLGDLQVYSSTVLKDAAKAQFYADPEMAELGDRPMGDRSPEELDAIVAKATDKAQAISAHRFNRLYQRVVAEGVYDRGIPAAEEKRAEYEASVSEDTSRLPAPTREVNSIEVCSRKGRSLPSGPEPDGVIPFIPRWYRRSAR